MKKIQAEPATSSATSETLESFTRTQVQGFIQQLLEDELTELLGQPKSGRRNGTVDAPGEARNGHGQLRKLVLMNGTITLSPPRVGDLEERFVNPILPSFQRRPGKCARCC